MALCKRVCSQLAPQGAGRLRPLRKMRQELGERLDGTRHPGGACRVPGGAAEARSGQGGYRHTGRWRHF